MAISRIKFSSLHSAKKSAPLILGESENGSSSEMLRVSDANYFSTRAPYLNAISVVCAKRALAPVCAGNGLYRRIQEAVAATGQRSNREGMFWMHLFSCSVLIVTDI